jgi:RNA polymerase sigma-70 factor (ECF subfamily)
MTREDLPAVVDGAVAARPTIDRAAFSAHLMTIAPDTGEICAADLALAFQALQGEQAAVAELHAIVERAARQALGVAGYNATMIDDAVQETSIRLLIGPAGHARPALLAYQGRARLPAWIKTIALRTASRLTEVSRRVSGDSTMLDQFASAHDPVSAVIKAELRPAVRAAFIAAIGGLSYFERELLAAVIIQGQTIDQLSRRHDVHRATAARWIGRARAALDDRLRHELGVSLSLAPDEVSSVLAAVATSMELTPDRLLEGIPGVRK